MSPKQSADRPDRSRRSAIDPLLTRFGDDQKTERYPRRTDIGNVCLHCLGTRSRGLDFDPDDGQVLSFPGMGMQ